MAENLTSGFMYELPNNTTKIGDVLMGTPMQYTDGFFINIFLIGFFSMLTIGASAYQVGIDKAIVYSTYTTFLLTFLLSLAGYAGGNQLIPASVAFIMATVYNMMNSGGAPV